MAILLSETQKNKPPTGFNLSDMIIMLSNARDAFFFCSQVQIEIENDPNFAELEQKTKALMLLVVNYMVDWYCQKINATTKILASAKLRNISKHADEAITEIKKFHEELLQGFEEKNYLTDSAIIHQLFSVLLQSKGLNFVSEMTVAISKHDFIAQLPEFFSDDKKREFVNEEMQYLYQILFDFSNNDELLVVRTENQEIKAAMEGLRAALSQILKKKELINLRSSFLAFNEIMTVNQSVSSNQLSESEIENLSRLLQEYYTEPKNADQKISADVIRVIFSLHRISPIFTFSFDELSALFNERCLLNKMTFLSGKFTNGNTLTRTYEALGYASAAYLKMLEALNNIYKAKKEAKIKPAALEQIERYISCLPNYFQLTMRFSMPLLEFVSAVKNVFKETKPAIESYQTEVDTAALSLSLQSEILQQMALTVNALKDITDFMERIQGLVATLKPNKLRVLSSIFFEGYDVILNEIYHYFCKISQSSRLCEDYTNYLSIRTNLDEILLRHKLKGNNLLRKVEARDPAERLVIEIYKRYSECASRCSSSPSMNNS